MPKERMIEVDGVDLCAETFGEPGHPAILLVHGASASMLWWPTEFCERLAAGRRYVIRYDNRDTGRSVSYPPGRPGYSLADLAEDAVGVLDALGVERAHLVGRSMAGAIVTLAALLHPDRVASLTLVSTTTGDPDLPPMWPEFVNYTSSAHPDPANPASVVDFVVGLMKVYANGSPYFDEAAMREVAEEDLARTKNIASCLSNHFAIDYSFPEAASGREVEAPVLVIHGAIDPVFPLAHGEALQRAHPGSELLVLADTGHDVPPQTWDVVVPAILRHTSGGWEEEEDRISSKALAAGDAVGWFDVLYRAGADGSVEMPWSRRNAHPLLVEWAEAQGLSGDGRSAVVVGCGLGADAEFISGLGFATTAFDVSPTAVRVARERHQGSAVRYVAADLLDLPADWAFDLVVEVITVQALPPALRRQAIDAVTGLVGAGGRLIVIAAIDDEDADSPPWPLTREDVDSFAVDGISAVRIETAEVPGNPDSRRWRAEFRRE